MKAKLTLYLLTIGVFQFVNCQNIQRINLGFTQNIDVWKPYTHVNEGSDLNAKRKSRTYTVSGTVTILNGNKFVLKTGPAFKHIKYTVEDRIKEFKVGKWSGGTYYTNYTQTNVDFASSSANLGLLISLEKKFAKYNRMTAGFTIEGYFLEFYKAEYPEPDSIIWTNPYYELSPKPSVSLIKDNFLLSNLNASVFYAYKFINKPSFSMALKASLGINGYSAWDQFSRYAWIGLGLEIGFGKIKAKSISE